MVCLECGSDMVLSTEPLTETYKGEPITVEGLEYYKCPDCGDVVMSAKMANKQAQEMARVYAERHLIMPPEEIVKIRKGLGLTQKQFERLLGVSSPTVCRWERGSSQQSEVANNLMRVMRDVPNAAAYLMALKKIRPSRTAPNSAQFTLVMGGRSERGAVEALKFDEIKEA